MTEGETRFYLREMHSHWCTSNVSAEKLSELHAAKLIEINEAPVPAVRLTTEGMRRKHLGRPLGRAGSISLARNPSAPRYHRRKEAQPAKRLV